MIDLPEQILIEALDRQGQGDPIDQILADYPQYAAQLGPLLQVTLQLNQISTQPYVVAKQASRDVFLAEAAQLSAKSTRPGFGLFSWRRFTQGLVMLTSILVLAFFSVGLLSSSAMPGDALYAPKLALESARLSFTKDPEAIQQLVAQYQAERIREVETLLRAGRNAEVEFEGIIEKIDHSMITLSGLPVMVDEQTRIDGTLMVGELARINGYTDSGFLYAQVILMMTGRPRPDLDEPTLKATPHPDLPEEDENINLTETPAATGTITPTQPPTTTPIQTSSATPSSTPTPSPTAIQQPVVPPGDNDNDDEGEANTNDNDNDNDGDDENDNDDDDVENDNENNDNSNDNDDDDNVNDGDD